MPHNVKLLILILINLARATKDSDFLEFLVKTKPIAHNSQDDAIKGRLKVLGQTLYLKQLIPMLSQKKITEEELEKEHGIFNLAKKFNYGSEFFDLMKNFKWEDSFKEFNQNPDLIDDNFKTTAEIMKNLYSFYKQFNQKKVEELEPNFHENRWAYLDKLEKQDLGDSGKLLNTLKFKILNYVSEEIFRIIQQYIEEIVCKSGWDIKYFIELYNNDFYTDSKMDFEVYVMFYTLTEKEIKNTNLKPKDKENLIKLLPKSAEEVKNSTAYFKNAYALGEFFKLAGEKEFDKSQLRINFEKVLRDVCICKSLLEDWNPFRIEEHINQTTAQKESLRNVIRNRFSPLYGIIFNHLPEIATMVWKKMNLLKNFKQFDMSNPNSNPDFSLIQLDFILKQLPEPRFNPSPETLSDRTRLKKLFLNSMFQFFWKLEKIYLDRKNSKNTANFELLSEKNYFGVLTESNREVREHYIALDLSIDDYYSNVNKYFLANFREKSYSDFPILVGERFTNCLDFFYKINNGFYHRFEGKKTEQIFKETVYFPNIRKDKTQIETSTLVMGSLSSSFSEKIKILDMMKKEIFEVDLKYIKNSASSKNDRYFFTNSRGIFNFSENSNFLITIRFSEEKYDFDLLTNLKGNFFNFATLKYKMADYVLNYDLIKKEIVLNNQNLETKNQSAQSPNYEKIGYFLEQCNYLIDNVEGPNTDKESIQYYSSNFDQVYDICQFFGIAKNHDHTQANGYFSNMLTQHENNASAVNFIYDTAGGVKFAESLHKICVNVRNLFKAFSWWTEGFKSIDEEDTKNKSGILSEAKYLIDKYNSKNHEEYKKLDLSVALDFFDPVGFTNKWKNILKMKTCLAGDLLTKYKEITAANKKIDKGTFKCELKFLNI